MTIVADPGAEIEAALAEAGIGMDVSRFLVILREALRAVHRNGVSIDPATQLTDTELAELRLGGFVVSDEGAAMDRVAARTAADSVALLANALTTAEAAHRLNVDPSRVRQLLGERALLGIKDGSEWRVLDIGFTDNGLVPNINTVLRALPEGLPAIGAISWLMAPEPDLEVAGVAVSPIDWLSAGGDPGRAAALAADL